MSRIYGFRSRQMASAFAAGYLSRPEPGHDVSVERIILPTGSKVWSVIVSDQVDVDEDVNDIVKDHSLPSLEN